MTTLTQTEKQRYQRQFALPKVGEKGQLKLKAAKVLCIGAGGLGCPALQYLNAVGVGTLGIVDHDTVDMSNLQRQILYNASDVGQLKVHVAKERLQKQNAHTTIHIYPEKINLDNALALIAEYDIVIDATDNFQARYLINDACMTHSKKLVYAAIHQFTGECSVFSGEHGPCYRCLYPENASDNPLPNCAESGVLGVLPGMLGTVQAVEAIKLILNIPQGLAGILFRLDALSMCVDRFTLQSNPDCPICAHNQTFQTLIKTQQEKTSMIQSTPQNVESITVQELKAMRDRNNDFVLLDVREPYEYDLCNLGGVLIPLGELSFRYEELPRDKDIIVHCRTDGRSLVAAELLCDAGFPSVKYLKGGIINWGREIDPSLAQY